MDDQSQGYLKEYNVYKYQLYFQTFNHNMSMMKTGLAILHILLTGPFNSYSHGRCNDFCWSRADLAKQLGQSQFAQCALQMLPPLLPSGWEYRLVAGDERRRREEEYQEDQKTLAITFCTLFFKPRNDWSYSSRNLLLLLYMHVSIFFFWYMPSKAAFKTRPGVRASDPGSILDYSLPPMGSQRGPIYIKELSICMYIRQSRLQFSTDSNQT